jgi:hypothetical protein
LNCGSADFHSKNFIAKNRRVTTEPRTYSESASAIVSAVQFARTFRLMAMVALWLLFGVGFGGFADFIFEAP